jgi:hypothetical protein
MYLVYIFREKNTSFKRWGGRNSGMQASYESSGNISFSFLTNYSLEAAA